jgi:hypothetical protein
MGRRIFRPKRSGLGVVRASAATQYISVGCGVVSQTKVTPLPKMKIMSDKLVAVILPQSCSTKLTIDGVSRHRERLRGVDDIAGTSAVGFQDQFPTALP